MNGYTKASVATSKKTTTHLCIGSKHQGDYVLTSHIVYIKAEEAYSWIYLKDGSRYLSTKTIGYYERFFSDDPFYRIHRSYLINLKHLKFYEPSYRLVHLCGELILPVSYRKNRLMSKEIEQYQSLSA